MPVPRAHGFGACSAHFLAPKPEVSWAQKWGCPQAAQCPASVHGYVELLMEGYIDSSKATVERKTEVNYINSRAWAVSSEKLQRLEVLQLAQEKEQNHQPEQPLTFRLFFHTSFYWKGKAGKYF